MRLNPQALLEGLPAGSGLPLGNRLVFTLVLAGGGLAGSLVRLDAVGSLHFHTGDYFPILTHTCHHNYPLCQFG